MITAVKIKYVHENQDQLDQLKSELFNLDSLKRSAERLKDQLGQLGTVSVSSLDHRIDRLKMKIGEIYADGFIKKTEETIENFGKFTIYGREGDRIRPGDTVLLTSDGLHAFENRHRLKSTAAKILWRGISIDRRERIAEVVYFGILSNGKTVQLFRSDFEPIKTRGVK